MKKLIALGTAAAVAVLVAGCTGISAAPTDSAPAGTNRPSTSAPAEQPATTPAPETTAPAPSPSRTEDAVK